MNELLERLNNFFGERPGLLPLAGILLIVLNFLLQIYPGPGSGWFVDSNALLHLGVIFGLVGMLLVRALS
jgi:H+/Cl- antiporter ClcA